MVSQCSWGCPGTHSKDQAGLQLRSAGLCLPTATIKVMYHYTWLVLFFKFCVCVWLCTHMCSGTHEGQKVLELELNIVISHLTWVLGTRYGLSARTGHTLDCWAISPAPAYSVPNNKSVFKKTKHAADMSSYWSSIFQESGCPFWTMLPTVLTDRGFTVSSAV